MARHCHGRSAGMRPSRATPWPMFSPTAPPPVTVVVREDRGLDRPLAGAFRAGNEGVEQIEAESAAPVAGVDVEARTSRRPRQRWRYPAGDRSGDSPPSRLRPRLLRAALAPAIRPPH